MTEAHITAITAAADYTLIIGGIAGIFGIMAAVYVVVKGGKLIIGALKSA